MLNKTRFFVVLFLLTGIVFLIDELWMFGLPLGHLLPDLSQFHIAPFGFQYHHWMTGLILITMSGLLFRRDRILRNRKIEPDYNMVSDE